MYVLLATSLRITAPKLLKADSSHLCFLCPRPVIGLHTENKYWIAIAACTLEPSCLCCSCYMIFGAILEIFETFPAQWDDMQQIPSQLFDPLFQLAWDWGIIQILWLASEYLLPLCNLFSDKVDYWWKSPALIGSDMIIPRLWLAHTGDRRQRHVVTYFDIHSLGHNYTITQAAAASGWHNNKVTSLSSAHSSVPIFPAPDKPMMFSNHGPSPALPPVTNSYRIISIITWVKTRRMFCFTATLNYIQGKFWRVIKCEGRMVVACANSPESESD